MRWVVFFFFDVFHICKALCYKSARKNVASRVNIKWMQQRVAQAGQSLSICPQLHSITENGAQTPPDPASSFTLLCRCLGLISHVDHNADRG